MTQRTIWNQSPIQVVLTGADVDPDPCFVGIMWHASHGLYSWQAFAKPEGYYVVYSRMGGCTIGSWTGPTFNLGLEVAQGFGRAVK